MPNHDNKGSPYRMGWILVAFDLPVGTDRERRQATSFRKFLKDDGFLMLQFSVYVRPCVSYEHIEKHAARLKGLAPMNGLVRIMFFTDKQWGLSINLIGEGTDVGGRETNLEMPEQILFW